MSRFRLAIPISIVLFLAFVLGGTYFVRKRILERAMLTAVEMEDLSMIRSLAESWPYPVNVATGVGIEDEEWWFQPGSTAPLHVAAREGDADLVRLLLDKGADPGARDSSDVTPLHAAVKSGNAEAVKWLIEKAADVNARAYDVAPVVFHDDVPQEPGTLAFSDGHGVTPLHIAAWFRARTDVVRLLLENGADVNARDIRGWTPLFGTVEFAREPDKGGLCDVANVLIAHGADVNAVEPHGWTPLHLAAWQGHPAIAELLLAKGSAVNPKNRDGKTPLRLAAEAKARVLTKRKTGDRDRLKRWDAVMEILFQHGAKE